MGSTSYIKNAAKNIKAQLTDDGLRFNPNLSDKNYSAKNPFSSNDYHPELDTKPNFIRILLVYYNGLLN
jgi:hypothetical protein